MDTINKHKFLAELGRLLAFMYEEDRQTVLAMYDRMFDETANEPALLELLGSPTRQAVVLARSYDAKTRKIQLESQDADMLGAEDAPAYIFAINDIAKQASQLGLKEEAVSEGQFSIFDELPSIDEAFEPAREAAASAVEAVALPELDESLNAVEDAEEYERSSVDETADAVDAFLADFTIANGELVSLKADPESLEPEEEAQDEENEAEAQEPVITEALPELEESPAEPPVKTRLKLNILLLIPYIFLAIPLGLIGIAFLLLPTVLSLCLAVACAYCGVYLIGMCFGSFAVIADTLAVFGGGLALCALALLFVWLFIWFLGGAIIGYIRGLCRLGRKLCCKEVAVQ